MGLGDERADAFFAMIIFSDLLGSRSSYTLDAVNHCHYQHRIDPKSPVVSSSPDSTNHTSHRDTLQARRLQAQRKKEAQREELEERERTSTRPGV